ncbi:hypothetical protein [Peribacillus simplex]|uniref:hypothetical protein n=1 Tax=Peribacillus simplex TaxID=1478 RepID=UPI0028530BC5|nr:hypothetical protein [Peribacillus simplex]MDR4926517.1 hypothetical protein [Peribacillus simplex]
MELSKKYFKWAHIKSPLHFILSFMTRTIPIWIISFMFEEPQGALMTIFLIWLLTMLIFNEDNWELLAGGEKGVNRYLKIINNLESFFQQKKVKQFIRVSIIKTTRNIFSWHWWFDSFIKAFLVTEFILPVVLNILPIPYGVKDSIEQYIPYFL